MSRNTSPKALSEAASQRIPGRGISTEEARLERLQFAREQTGAPLDTLQHTDFVAERLNGNIENFIGSVEVPVGLAGPLVIHGAKAAGVFYLPMATSEGALVASTTRGATAITRSGGASARVLHHQMLRVPLFVLANMQQALLLADCVREQITRLRTAVGQVSRHARLLQAEPLVMGKQVHVRFVYQTGDAAGQNMTTTCTWHACQWLMTHLQKTEDIVFEHFLIDGNSSGDKKVSYQSFIAGRGTRVSAEAFISSEILLRVLKTTPEQVVQCNQLGMIGASQSGMIGYNINTANIIAASFTALGQDIACVHESSVAQFQAQQVEGGLYVSMLLPALVIGTVGGGTALPRQRQMLEMLQCAGPGKVSRLAEVIASYCLALDLSTMCALATGQFVSAHERLGRNRPVDWLKKSDLDAAFFQRGLRQSLQDNSLEVTEVRALPDFQDGSSIVSELTARKVDKFVGLAPVALRYRTAAEPSEQTLEVVAKVKPLDSEVILMSNGLAAMCSPGLREAHAQFKERTGAALCHLRELAICQQVDPRFTRHTPKIYDAFRDDAREAHILVMEKLDSMVLMDSVDDISGWQKEPIEAVLQGLGSLHSIWYNKTDELRSLPWLGSIPSVSQMIEMSPLWEQLGVHAAQEFPEWVSPEDQELHRHAVSRIPHWWAELDKMPKTLVHNDFNPRNLCLRKSSDPTDIHGLRLCAYDWELATVHIPQHDLAEFLCFVLPNDVSRTTVDHYVEVHRLSLEKASGTAIDATLWRRGFYLSLLDLVVNRFMLYVMAHTFRHYRFLKRATFTLRHLIRMESGR